MISFLEKHKKGVAIISFSLILFICTCVFYIYTTGTSILTLNDITKQYENLSGEQQATEAQESTTVPTDETVSVTEEPTSEKALGELTEIQTEKQGLVSDLSTLINDFYRDRTGLGAGNDINVVLQKTRKYLTGNCYENYMIPFYNEKDPLVRPVDWTIASTIKYADLETDTPKAVVFTTRTVTQMYSVLEFTEIDGKWYINNIYDYIEEHR